MKKTGTRILYLVAGIILIAIGAYLSWLEIKEHNGNGHHRKWHKYPFLIAGAGIVVFVMAFMKEEKPKITDQKTGP